MQILLIILLLVIGILTLTGLFFFYDRIKNTSTLFKNWVIRNWKKILGVTIGGMIIGGVVLIPRDTEFPSVGIGRVDITAESDDGYIDSTGELDWNDVHDAPSGTASSSSATDTDCIKGSVAKGSYYISRTFFEFDTSSLADDVTIDTANLFIYGSSSSGSDDTIVVASSQGETLDNDDFNNIDVNTPYSAEITSWTVGGWNNISLNTAGKSAVNLTGKTYMAILEHDHDYLDSVPAGENKIGCYFSEEAGKEPYLNITYSLPNNVPTFSGEIPSDNSGGISLSPTMNITIWDTDGEDTTVDWYYNATIGSGSWTHIDHYTGHSANTSNATSATSGINQYNHNYNIKVTANDTYDNSSTVWNFTTIDYTPDAPASFTTTSYMYQQINITWTDDTEADSTRVEWNPTVDGTWNVGDHSLLYNASAEHYEHTGLDPDEDYFYKAWSWNSTQGVWSSGSTSSETIGKAPIEYTLTKASNILQFNLQNNTNDVEPESQTQSVYAINITNDNSVYIDLDIRLNETTIDNVSLYYNIEYDNSSSNWAIYSGTTNITCIAENGSVYWRYRLGDAKTKAGLTYYNGSIYTQVANSPFNLTRLNASTDTMSAGERVMASQSTDKTTFSTPVHSNGYIYCNIPGTVEGHSVISCHYSNNLTYIWESDTQNLNGIDYYTRVYSQLAMADGILLWMDDNWNVVALGNLTQYNSSFHTDWDEYGRTYCNHGVAESSSNTNLSKDVLWVANATGTYDEFGGVSVHDGIVYVSPKDTYLNPFPGHSGMSAIYLNNGTIKWQDTVDINSDNTPTYWNGYLYSQSVSESNNTLFCVDASDGSLVWSKSTSHPGTIGAGGVGSVSSDGIVATSSDGHLYAFYAMNGTELWNVNLSGGDSYSAGISPLTINNSVYIINANSTNGTSIFYSYNLHNGTKNWQVYDGGVHWDSTPCAVNHGGSKEKLYNYSFQLDDTLAPGESCTLYLWGDLDGNMTTVDEFSRYINITLSANEEGYETGYVEVEAWFNLTGDSATIYDTTVRTNGEDYFVWLGQNLTASGIKTAIGATFNESGETISRLANSGSWETYTGTGTGTNFNVYTFDVIKIILDDGAGTLTFNMTKNSNMTYDISRNVDLIKIGNGYNYTGWVKTDSSTLSAENTTLSLATGYFIALWNETNYNWDYWISGFGFTNKSIHQYDVVMTKIAATKNNWAV